MPVNVWKQLRRKVDVSRTSIPVRWEEGMAREAGVRDLVIAWTLWGGGQLLVAYGRFLEGGRRGGWEGERYPWKVPARTSRSLTETLLRVLLKSRL